MFNNKFQRDMQFKDYSKAKLSFFVALSALFVLASCGSYQHTGYDNDGIYSSDKQPETTTDKVVETTTSDASYFKTYFSEKSDEYEAIVNDSEIFTDIDSYEGYPEQEVDSLEYSSGNSGWGDEYNAPTEINIYYSAGWLRPGWIGSWGWHNWRFNNFGWGAYSPYWNNWGWGFGFNNGWGWNTGWAWGWYDFGWGWNNYWCPPYYGYGGNNFYAYNYGRRGGSLYNGYSRLGRTSAALNRNTIRRNTLASTSVTRNTRRSITRNTGRTVTRNTGRSVTRSTSRPRTRANTSRPRTRVNTSRPRTNTSRPRTVSPSRSTTVRGSSGGGRSSGISRSSGSSSRGSASRGGGSRGRR